MATAIEIATTWAVKHAPKGLIVSDDPQGNANGARLSAYIAKRGLDVTLETLSEAAESEKHHLIWLPGYEPKPQAPAAPARPKGSRFNQLADGRGLNACRNVSK